MARHRTLVFLAALALAAPLWAAPAHVHGAAQLDLVVDGGQLTLALEMPLDSALGFEHPPRTAQERAALVAVRARLAAADLFTPTPEAGCTRLSAVVGEPFANASTTANAHADIDAEYRFGCRHAGMLRSLSTTLFVHFPRLQDIAVQRVSAQGQGAARLLREAPALAW